jgi:hypothetical protein
MSDTNNNINNNLPPAAAIIAVIPPGSEERADTVGNKKPHGGQQSRTLLCWKKLATLVHIFLHLGRQRSAGRMLLRLSKAVVMQPTIIGRSRINL